MSKADDEFAITQAVLLGVTLHYESDIGKWDWRRSKPFDQCPHWHDSRAEAARCYLDYGYDEDVDDDE